MRRMDAIREQLKCQPDEQLSQTDADARSMISQAKGTGVVGYNVQAAVDAKHHLIVAHEVTNVSNDRAQLTKMTTAAKEAMHKRGLEVLADRGYFSGPEIKACTEAGITPLVPKPMTSGASSLSELQRYGLISKLDRAALAAYCQAYARWKHAEEKLHELGDAGLVETTLTGYRQIGPWLQISNRAVETMQKFLAEFGMSPSARTRVTPSKSPKALPGADKTNPWAQFEC
jgi:P27 family predicted phage terminase small subunit